MKAKRQGKERGKRKRDRRRKRGREKTDKRGGGRGNKKKWWRQKNKIVIHLKQFSWNSLTFGDLNVSHRKWEKKKLIFLIFLIDMPKYKLENSLTHLKINLEIYVNREVFAFQLQLIGTTTIEQIYNIYTRVNTIYIYIYIYKNIRQTDRHTQTDNWMQTNITVCMNL